MSASLLVVFVAAKIAVLWGRAGPMTLWSPAAYFWQDVLAATVFAVVEFILPRAARPLYWALAVYAAINIPVGRALATPLTWPMLHAARGPLGDSMLMYATVTNGALMAVILVLAAILPRFTRSRLMPAVAVAAVIAGPIASARVDTHGLNRNVITALISLPHVRAAGQLQAAAVVRRSGGELLRYRGAARGFNVVMIALESTAAQYVSPEVMPNLSRLAERAMVFENAYAVYPESIKGLFSVICSSRPAIDTTAESYEEAPCQPLVQVLASAGFRTGLFHSGRFDYLGMESIVRHRGYQTLEDAGDIGGNHRSSFGVDEPATVARILSWIDGGRQPFFVAYLPIAGHHPYATPAPGPFPVNTEMDQYRNALHYGDASLGELAEALRARGLDRSTVWIIYGDHGEAFGQHAGNYGHTFFVYEENVHVPLLIVAPGLMDRQERVRKVVSLVDAAPTILDLAGIAVPKGYQGRSMLEPVESMALFFADYSLRILGLRDGPWKFMHEIGSGRSRLFNLEQDPNEACDLAGKERARVSGYKKLIIEF